MSTCLPRSLSLALVMGFAVLAGTAQTGQNIPPRGTAPVRLVIDNLGKGAVRLNGPWQFHVGDDPAWSAPEFDDSHWEQISADLPWANRGISPTPDLPGTACMSQSALQRVKDPVSCS